MEAPSMGGKDLRFCRSHKPMLQESPSMGGKDLRFCRSRKSMLHGSTVYGREGSAVLSIPQTVLHGSTRPPLVIPTGAYPDFLPRRASNDHGRGSPQR